MVVGGVTGGVNNAHTQPGLHDKSGLGGHKWPGSYSSQTRKAIQSGKTILTFQQCANPTRAAKKTLVGKSVLFVVEECPEGLAFRLAHEHISCPHHMLSTFELSGALRVGSI